jgi:alpha-tubulin suppressor-like RCC1 family protein
VSIDSGYNHVCATLSTGNIRCFGQNSDGQVGNGSTGSFVEIPVAVSGITSPVVALSAGGSSSCSMLANGSVACWGLNGMGQLGDGTGRRAVSAVSAGWWKPITPAIGVQSVGLGYSHTCALKNNQVKCWGNNINGQVGNAIPTGTGIGAVTTTPVVVGGLTGNIVSLVSGNLHNCVLIDDGSVKCWGGNSAGQLGNGVITFTAQALPVDVIGLHQPATAIMAAGDFTCAALQDKTAKCWGSNSHGQLGAGLTIASSATPLTVYDLFGVTALSGKMVHACALLEDKSTKCWGANYSGQLGDGTTTNRNIPVANSTWIKDVVRISAGTNNTCIIRNGNSMWCWGNFTGNGSATLKTSPTDVASLYNVSSISSGDFNSCAVIANGTVKCFGSDNALLGDGTGVASSGNSHFPNSVRWLVAPATEIVHGRNGNACAILVTGQLSCWGNNGFGKLGDGTQVTRHEPVVVNL